MTPEEWKGVDHLLGRVIAHAATLMVILVTAGLLIGFAIGRWIR